MQKKAKAGFPCDATPDTHHLCDNVEIRPVPDPGNEIPLIAPGLPHEWKEMRLSGENLSSEQ